MTLYFRGEKGLNDREYIRLEEDCQKINKWVWSNDVKYHRFPVIWGLSRCDMEPELFEVQLKVTTTQIILAHPCYALTLY